MLRRPSRKYYLLAALLIGVGAGAYLVQKKGDPSPFAVKTGEESSRPEGPTREVSQQRQPSQDATAPLVRVTPSTVEIRETGARAEEESLQPATETQAPTAPKTEATVEKDPLFTPLTSAKPIVTSTAEPSSARPAPVEKNSTKAFTPSPRQLANPPSKPSNSPASASESSPLAPVASSPPAPFATTPNFFPRQDEAGLRLFFGLGVSYVLYKEDLTDVATDYHDFRGPSTLIGVAADVVPGLAVEASYKNTPIRFDNSSVNLDALKGSWQTLVLQGASGSRPDRIGELLWKFLWGFQLHQMPLALFENGTNTPVMKNVQLATASVGAEGSYMTNERTRLNMLMRYQQPIGYSASAGGSALSMTSKLFFDGSVGIDKKIGDKVWMGLHWYGQSHNFKFKYRDADVTAEGDHSGLFSTLELRLGFDF